MPGPQDLLMSHPAPAADPALRASGGDAEMTRAIRATTALRGWREDVGAVPGRPVPARPEAEGYEGVAGPAARLARFEFSGNGDPAHPDPVATVGVPGGNVAVLASEAV